MVLMRFTLGSAWELMPGLKGVQHLGGTAVEVVLGLAGGPAGTLDVVFRAPELPVGIEGITGHAQPVVAVQAGSLRLGAPSTALIVDATIAGP
ncbi:MAG: hypothetical protein ACYTG2_13880 [Planctomycetota bacterium]